MNEFLIKSYVNKLTKKEIETFSKKQGLSLTEEELTLILNHIKKDWHTIIYGNPRPILDDLKSNMKETSYNKVEALYIEFKNKYKNYL